MEFASDGKEKNKPQESECKYVKMKQKKISHIRFATLKKYIGL